MRRLVLGLTALSVSACGIDVIVGGPRPDGLTGNDSGSPDSGDSAAHGDSSARDSGPTRVDSGDAVFHFIEPTAAHVQRAAGDPGRLRGITVGFDVSADGSVVLGRSSVVNALDQNSSEGDEIFRWTAASGTVGLGFVPQCKQDSGKLPFAQPRMITSDGSAILGTCVTFDGNLLLRWTEASGLVGLSAPQGLTFSSWIDFTPDGTTAVGQAMPQAGLDPPPQALRWTQATGLVGLGLLAGAPSSDDYGGMSPDGKIVIGQSGTDIFRWSEATGMVALPKPQGGYTECLPAHRQGVSTDGTIIVGSCTRPFPPGGFDLFRWQGTSPPRLIPMPPGGSLQTEGAMSEDGSAIFGTWAIASQDPTRAFRWTESTGTVDFSLPGYDSCRVDPGWRFGRVANADATVLFGGCSSELAGLPRYVQRAFRWTPGTGPVALRPLAGDDSTRALSMSSDGSMIVGYSMSSLDTMALNIAAVIWDVNGNPTSVADRLTSLGADLQGFKPDYVNIPPINDHLLLGGARNAAGVSRAWIARLP